MSKSAVGENGKDAQTRAVLFDLTFLMLIDIIQLYGLEVRSAALLSTRCLHKNAPTLTSCSFDKHGLILINIWQTVSAHSQKGRAYSTFLLHLILLTLFAVK